MVLDQERLSRVRELLCSHPKGLTISEISTELGINRNSLAKYLNMLTISGQLEMQSYGASRV
ncbi:MAG TPA: helix-turn-helix domain-containing protein [Methanoregulaceae archaeon]|nr:helix-turn-helix domain-containing protein [Methanoregulaceae archaeon]